MRLIIGATMLLLTLPKVGIKCLQAWYQQKKITLYVQKYAGKNMECVQHRTVTIANTPLSDIDTWFLYLKGHYNLIGPTPIDYETACRLESNTRIRLEVAPGIISPFDVKKASGIAHQTESQVAVEFVKNDTLARRAQVFLIWCLQRSLGSSKRNLSIPRRFQLLGVTLTNITMKGAVERITNCLDSKPKASSPTKFAFVNADCVNKYHTDPGYKQVLNQFNDVFADGVGVKIAARWQGVSVIENVNGTDMFPLLCAELSAKNKSIYLLGATNKVVTEVVANLKTEHPSLRIAGQCDGFSYRSHSEELTSRINSSGADLLLVAMGAPRQEQWITDNQDRLNVKAVIGVGGLFDFYSKQVSRAPIWLRELSLEWVWRLFAQPLDKGKRYLVGNPLFLLRAALAAKANRRSKNLDRSTVGEMNHDTL